MNPRGRLIRGSIWGVSLVSLSVSVCLLGIGSLAPLPGGSAAALAQGQLVVDGNFEASTSSVALRSAEKPQGWYESRQDGSVGPKLLKLSKKSIRGNATHKAMIKGSARRNTYLTQSFNAPQTGRFSLQWDVYVRSIHKSRNRSAFQMIGASGTRGPNAQGNDRFVFLAFQNSRTPGRIDLVAFEGGSRKSMSQRTVLFRDLDRKTWHTVRVDVDVPGRSYTVSLPGTTSKPIKVKAFDSGKGIPKELTAVSFASWNDGSGTFYIDNVKRP